MLKFRRLSWQNFVLGTEAHAIPPAPSQLEKDAQQHTGPASSMEGLEDVELESSSPLNDFNPVTVGAEGVNGVAGIPEEPLGAGLSSSSAIKHLTSFGAKVIWLSKCTMLSVPIQSKSCKR